MRASIARAGLAAAALFLAGCNATLEDIAPKSERQLPAAIVNTIKAKGMTTTSPIMLRIFKEEGVLEVWKQKDTGRYDLVTSYEICKWSGKLGPKYKEGDRQAPEGFYFINPGQMNPKSSYHLAFNIGFPNAFDRAHGRSGAHLMVHGACSSSGCYSMTDEQVEQIYAFARDAFKGGQQAFQLQAFPFRMSAENMARYKDDPNFEFWTMLKEGYDHFEITKIPPKVDVCEKRYVFNLMPEEGREFSATGACPSATQPDSLKMAYSTYVTGYQAAFSAAIGGTSKLAPKPSIMGIKEASLVSEWSKKRARGERVSREPPSMEAVAATSSDDVSTAALPQNAPAPVAAPAAPSVTPPDAAEEPAASAPVRAVEQAATAKAGRLRGDPEQPEAPAKTAAPAAAAVQTPKPPVWKRAWKNIFGG